MIREILNKIIIAVLLVTVFTSVSFAAPYPTKNINGIICWGAGGGTDNVVRAINPMVDKELGKPIVLQNKPGAAGVIAMTQVYNAPADGYTIMYQAENPGIYQVMQLSKITYDDFIPIMLILQGVNMLIVPINSPYMTIDDLIKAANSGANLKQASCGVGSQEHVVSSMFKNITGATFATVNFDGNGAAVAAVMGGHVDLAFEPSATVLPFLKAGKVRCLATMTTERYEETPDVPAIVEYNKGFAKYLPWGAFYGAFVKKGTPQEIVDKLTIAYTKAINDKRFIEFAKNFGGIRLGLNGQAAKAYLDRHKSISSWLIYSAGDAKKSPAEFNILEPK